MLNRRHRACMWRERFQCMWEWPHERLCTLSHIHIHANLDTHPEQGARSLRAGSVGVGESGVKVRKHAHFYSSNFLQRSMRTKELEETQTQTHMQAFSHAQTRQTEKPINYRQTDNPIHININSFIFVPLYLNDQKCVIIIENSCKISQK